MADYVVWLNRKTGDPCLVAFAVSVMSYTVYRADFTTERGTDRSYWGYTGNLELRADKIGIDSADWARCMRRETLDMKQMAINIKSRQVALLIEAHFAAKSILARPLHVRGGPWLSVRPLTAAEMTTIRQVAGFTTLTEFAQYVETLEESNVL